MAIGLIDGPVATLHPDFNERLIQAISGGRSLACESVKSVACIHGTFVAGILVARRGSVAPAICPGCRLLVRPIFAEAGMEDGVMPSASAETLAAAVLETIDAGARLINISAGLAGTSCRGELAIRQALDYAARRGVIIIVAAGNHGTVGSSPITRHPWPITVTACDLRGRLLNGSNLGRSIGRRGLAAPGESIMSLGADGRPRTFAGTSAAAPFVTGATALIWSEFPEASAAEVRLAITRLGLQPRNTLFPPLLDASSAYQTMAATRPGAKPV